MTLLVIIAGKYHVLLSYDDETTNQRIVCNKQ